MKPPTASCRSLSSVPISTGRGYFSGSTRRTEMVAFSGSAETSSARVLYRASDSFTTCLASKVAAFSKIRSSAS